VSLRAVRNAVTREIEVISAGPRRIFKGIGEAEEL